MPATANDTFNKILSILTKEYKIDTAHFTLQTTIADSGLDSLAMADLLFEAEDVFDIKLEDIPASNMPTTLAELVALIDSELAKKPTA